MTATRKSTPPPALPAATDDAPSGVRLRLVAPPPDFKLPRKATGVGTRPPYKLPPVPERWLREAEDTIPVGRLTRAECETWEKPCALIACRHNTANGTRRGAVAIYGDCSLRLASGGPMTLEEVGERLSMSRERIRQIEERALRRLGKSDAGRRLLEAFGFGTKRSDR